jgi:hypothetical protein
VYVVNGHKVKTLVAWRNDVKNNKSWSCAEQKTPKNTPRHWHLFQTVWSQTILFKSEKKVKIWTHWTSIHLLTNHDLIQIAKCVWILLRLNIDARKHNKPSNLTFCYIVNHFTSCYSSVNFKLRKYKLFHAFNTRHHHYINGTNAARNHHADRVANRCVTRPITDSSTSDNIIKSHLVCHFKQQSGLHK